MAHTQPISLPRLRSATAAYKSVLSDSLPDLLLLAEQQEAPELANPTRELLEAIETTLDLSHGGGVADILRRLVSALGEE